MKDYLMKLSVKSECVRVPPEKEENRGGKWRREDALEEQGQRKRCRVAGKAGSDWALEAVNNNKGMTHWAKSRRRELPRTPTPSPCGCLSNWA